MSKLRKKLRKLGKKKKELIFGKKNMRNSKQIFEEMKADNNLDEKKKNKNLNK